MKNIMIGQVGRKNKKYILGTKPQEHRLFTTTLASLWGQENVKRCGKVVELKCCKHFAEGDHIIKTTHK